MVLIIIHYSADSAINSTIGALTVGDTSVCHHITVLENDVVEPDGQIVVRITSSSLHPSVTLLSVSEANLSIINDDSE